MNIRRFTASEMKEALIMVKRALGEDAIILKTRKVRKGGLLSFLSKEMIEVTAATPDYKPNPQDQDDNKAAKIRQTSMLNGSTEVIHDLKTEINDLKGHVHDLAEQMKFERMPSLPRRLSKRYKDMVTAGVDDILARELAQELNIHFKGEDLENENIVDNALLKLLANRIKIRRIPNKRNGKVRVFAFVGPTGVGKTTTLAKMVTSHRHWGNRDTVLISADTYRVAAIEQLKTFASIAGLPMETVYQSNVMKNVISRHSERDAIFIDTAGRSQADAEKLDELETFIEAAEPDEVFLCLAVSTRLEDQLDIIKRYSRLKPTGLIFTKLDESRGPGMIISTLVRSDIPLMYLTCGQSVPDDIVSVNPGKLADLILKPEKLLNLQKTHFESWIDEDNEGRS
ncbi:MAG: flagellar biosynthesis protein FlhF [Calditrichaeota bacterium]|nr:flagellar biosynthesis protein FlhF [Calditrichota bacterium]